LKNTLLAAIVALTLCGHTAMAGAPPACAPSTAYNSRVARADFADYAISDGSRADAVGAFIQKQLPNLQNKQAGIKPAFSSASLAAYHYSFYQTCQGIPIYQAEIKVNVSKKNVVYAIFDASYDMWGWVVDTNGFDYAVAPGYREYVSQYFHKSISPDVQQVLVCHDSAHTAELCYDIQLNDHAGKNREVLVSRAGILYQRDACMYAAEPFSDSTVTGRVYNPDPITTGDTVYGGNYINNNDSDNVKLTAQEQPVTFTADFQNDSFYLQNQYLQMTNLGNIVNPVVTDTPSFNFTRSQNGFEDVMVFYHLNVRRQYLHNMGFTYGDTLLLADAHYTTQDESFFAEPNKLCIGTGGVPDGQDCDVFVHEFTHFLSWQANGTNHGTEERAGLDEGTADYDAASYSKSIDPYQWYWVFNWDGHNEFWPGRVVNSTLPYSYAQAQGDRYSYGTCWASSLMYIWNAASQSIADSLVFETLYSYGLSTTLPQGAELLLKTDSLLYNGAHTCIIIQAFAERAVVADDSICDAYKAGISEINNPSLFKFTAYPDGFTATSPDPAMTVDADLYDMAGRKLATYTAIGSEIKPDLPNGIYIVNISSPDGTHQGYKWVHY
jgi:hypothetical protein